MTLAILRIAAEHHSGAWTYAMFSVVRSLSVVYPPAPGFPIDLLAIRLFGPVAGFVVAECGIMLGGSAAFMIARAASPRLAKTFGGKWRLLRYLEDRLPTADMTST